MHKMILVLILATAQLTHASDRAPASTENVATAYDTSLILGTVTDEGGAYAGSDQPDTFCSLTSGKTLTQNSIVPISGVYKCDRKYSATEVIFYEVMIAGKPFYVDQTHMFLKEVDEKRLNSMPAESFPQFKAVAKSASEYKRKKELESALAAVEVTRKHGLTILESSIYDTSEYTEGTGFKVVVHNPAAKTIKYVSFTVVGYNAVNDPVRGRAKGPTSITVKGVGPIKQNESATYDWEYMWFTDLVQRFKIKEIKLQYMDGTKRTIKNTDAITLSPRHLEIISEDN